jgi:hypothetical protein
LRLSGKQPRRAGLISVLALKLGCSRSATTEEAEQNLNTIDRRWAPEKVAPADKESVGLRRQAVLHTSAMGTWGRGPFDHESEKGIDRPGGLALQGRIFCE